MKYENKLDFPLKLFYQTELYEKDSMSLSVYFVSKGKNTQPPTAIFSINNKKKYLLYLVYVE